MQTAMLFLHPFKGSYIVVRDQFGCATNSRGRPFWLSYLDPSPHIWHVDVVRRAAHRLSGKEVLPTVCEWHGLAELSRGA